MSGQPNTQGPPHPSQGVAGAAPPYTQYSDPLDRFWSLYLIDADKQDAKLVERWKGASDGILIFTGLFATTVGSFIISTYPNLQPNSSDQSAATLLVISQQLSQITQLLSSPERFGFNNAVDAIITLLHVSVSLFAAGFLVFVLDLNDLVARTLLAIVITFGVIYMIMTMLPVVFPDCPFSTPLTLLVRVVLKYPAMRNTSQTNGLATTISSNVFLFPAVSMPYGSARGGPKNIVPTGGPFSVDMSGDIQVRAESTEDIYRAATGGLEEWLRFAVRRDVLLLSVGFDPLFMRIQRLLFFIRVILSYAILPESPVAAHTDIWQPILRGLHWLTMKVHFCFLPDESRRIIWKIYQVFGRDDLVPEGERVPWNGEKRVDLSAVFEQWPVLEDVLRSLADAIVAQHHSRSVVHRSSAPAIVLSAEFKVRYIWDRIFAERRGNNQENHEDDSEGRVVRRCSSAPAIASYSEHGSRQPMDGKAEDNGDNGPDPAPASDHISPDDIV
ncbi:hypothetical protein K488DRAFT_71604 [Vararia minispora EC-137]|uniref:Uncharacterized protein n=1 Tax=Vararia minispora EC-137 TaxID=1314806 RepID=A0ACB8QHM2_9AGAM|nr:hypothetical protein K488DRAFT_71604 [Vararia minispora EC-137]